MIISIKAARINSGIKQQEAAKIVNVTVATMSRWEAGKSKIPATALLKLCDAYGIKIDEIKI